MRAARLPVPALLLALAACAGPEGAFPSLKPRPGEVDRVIAPAEAAAVPRLSETERAALLADLRREAALLAGARQELAAADRALTPLLAAARGAAVGSEAWTQAQLALSRYDSARGPLPGLSARLAPLQLTVDSLAQDDADRRQLVALLEELAATERQAAARAAAADRLLSR